MTQAINMVEREKVSEMEVSIGMRAHLGPKLYFQIAHYNPRRYLYELDEYTESHLNLEKVQQQ